MLSSCLRRQCRLAVQTRMTPKRNPDKRAAERNLKRLKNAAKYTMEISENKETHKWMNDKRIRAMSKFIEQGFNTNRLTEKIDKKSAAEYMTAMKNLEMRLYWEVMHNRTFEEEFAKYYDTYFAEDIESLPNDVREEYEISIKQDREEREVGNALPEEINPDNLYWEHTMRLNSEEEAKLIALKQRVRKLSESRLMEDE